eukprot:TRINITY_DN13253_c0_g1_i1.p1 TRINITY_DN13253_c0_g1~~TRINITY_DN13253_c0_g1_i1.p1  ORF type:complete len:685 (-),score=165.33 TRINITY_DN13253_c0_g1_i1:263-2317(-)
MAAASGAREAFFSTLPVEMTPAEEELRDFLRLLTNAAGALLPSEVTLQEWVEHRMPGEVMFSTSPSGTIHISTYVDDLEATTPAAFFAKLPEDRFRPEEDKLRTALTSVLANGPLSLNSVMMDAQVKAARSAALPEEVELHTWIETRIGAEITVYTDDVGQRMFRLAVDDSTGASTNGLEALPNQVRANFFAGLPDGSFLPEEETLRDQIFNFLAAWSSQDLATLSHVEANHAVSQARAAILPKEISLKEWVEGRIGGEIELRQDKKTEQWVIHLSPTARPIVKAKYEAMEKAAQDRKMVANSRDFLAKLPADKLTDAEVNLRSALVDWLHTWHARRPGVGPPVLADAGQSKGVQQWKAALLPREVTLREWIEKRIGGEIELVLDERGQYQVFARGRGARSTAPPPPAPPAPPPPPVSGRRADAPPPGAPRLLAGSATEAFFKGLPADELTDEEVGLRQAVHEWMEQVTLLEAPPFLLDASRDPAIQQARTALLPGEVPLRLWIERRIGAEIEVTKDDRGRFLMHARGGEKQRRTEDVGKREQLEAFFEALPSDGFAEDEENLRAAVLQFLETWKGKDPPTITLAGQDPEIKKWRISFLKSVSLKEWIDRRIGGEVEMAMGPSDVWVLGVRGTLDLESLARKRSLVAESGKGRGRGAKDTLGGGCGAPPWKRARGEERGGQQRR